MNHFHDCFDLITPETLNQIFLCSCETPYHSSEILYLASMGIAIYDSAI